MTITTIEIRDNGCLVFDDDDEDCLGYLNAIAGNDCLNLIINLIVKLRVIFSCVCYSNWASPIVVVPKKDGALSICVDFKRTFNILLLTLISIRYPIVSISLHLLMEGNIIPF